MKKSSSDLTMGSVAKQLLMFVKKGEDAYEETSLYLHCNHYSGSCVHSGADWYQCLSEVFRLLTMRRGLRSISTEYCMMQERFALNSWKSKKCCRYQDMISAASNFLYYFFAGTISSQYPSGSVIK